jgi:hypothetical protein
VLADLAKTDAAIGKLTDKRADLVGELDSARELYGLLYETGPALEHAIRLGLGHLGFKAEPYKAGESEFDVVFVAPEGRCLGEAEGKDAKAINVDKMSQLERNLQEDFARDEVTEFAKGVLFGNAHRFTAPKDREDSFTAKCISAAKRLRVALIRTPDLFFVARYLAEAADEDFATRCRKAIFDADGEIVAFPTPPEPKGA